MILFWITRVRVTLKIKELFWFVLFRLQPWEGDPQVFIISDTFGQRKELKQSKHFPTLKPLS